MGLLVYQGAILKGTGSVSLPVFALCTLSFFALGYGLSGLFKTARVYTVLGNVIIIPITILSGAMVHPGSDAGVDPGYLSLFDPLAHAVTLLRGLWFGESWDSTCQKWRSWVVCWS